MPMFTKKPQQFEGREVSDDLRETLDVARWCDGSVRVDEESIYIRLPDGHEARPGWWIIQNEYFDFVAMTEGQLAERCDRVTP